MKRKLAVILSSDVAGYSRLVAQDEEDTVARFADISALFREAVTKHGGRVFNTAGDAILAEFDSAVSAVRCATDIQELTETANLGQRRERRIEFRIGVALGDVMITETGDLLGDGVNIAARLQGLAERGAVCVSEEVHTHVASKVALKFVDLGRRQLKNIPMPVHAYQLAGRAPPPNGVGRGDQRAHSSRARWLAGLVLALAVGASLWWLLGRSAPPHTTAIETTSASTATSHWLNGTWAALLTRNPVSEADFCHAADRRCRFFRVPGIDGDGRYEGAWGYTTGEMGPATFTISGTHLDVITPSNSQVNADLQTDGMLRGYMTAPDGSRYTITMRKLGL